MSLSTSSQTISQQSFDNKLDEIERKISQLNDSFKTFFWMTSLSEGNINVSYWRKYFVKNNIEKDNNILKPYLLLITNLIVLFKNFLKEFFLSILLHSQNNIKKNKNFIYLNASHIKKKNNKLFCILTESYIEQDDENLYLLSITRRSLNSLSSVSDIIKHYYIYSKSKNIIILESFFRPLQVLKNYFSALFFIVLSIRIHNSLNSNKSLFIINLIDIAKQSQILSIGKNKNFLKIINRKFSIICPVFELVEGRAIIYLFNEIRVNTIGIVHGLPGKIHNLRLFRSLKNIPQKAKPNYVLTTGKYINDKFKDYGFKNSYEVGYIRENTNITDYNSQQVQKKKIIFLLDMHHWKECIDLTCHLSEKYELLYKPHPMMKENVERYLFSKKKIKIIDNMNFNKENLYPELILTGDTGAASDYINKQYPCCYLNIGLNNSFLININKNIKFKVFNKDNILKFDEYYNLNKIQQFKLYVDKEICQYFGHDSQIRFKNIIKKINEKNFNINSK